MASSSHHPPNTTFVQADPSSFRSVVQQLTGAPNHPSSPKLPLTIPSRLLSGDIAPKKTSFKLHERRHPTKKMALSIGVSHRPTTTTSSSFSPVGPSPSSYGRTISATFMASPVSPLEMLEERVIVEKGFFLHPSPIGTPRSPLQPPPELLPLFPVDSPANNNNQRPKS